MISLKCHFRRYSTQRLALGTFFNRPVFLGKIARRVQYFPYPLLFVVIFALQSYQKRDNFTERIVVVVVFLGELTHVIFC